MIEYNNRTVYDCFNNIFTFYGGNPDLNLPPMPIDDSPRAEQKSRYTSDPLPAAISVASGKSGSKLTTTSESPNVIFLYYNDDNTRHTIMIYNPFCGRGGKSILLQYP